MTTSSYVFFGGTFLPSRRASESPIAIACFGFVTFLPLRPDFSFPCFISRISLSTFLLADGEYLRPDDFFELDFLDEDFFEDEPRVLFLALLPREERLELLLRDDRLELLPREDRDLDPLRRELLLDFFLVAFFVAITILLAGQMASCLEQVACRRDWLLVSEDTNQK